MFLSLRRSPALKYLLPSLLVLIWLGIASVGGPTFGKLSSIATNDQASFLPTTADSTKVQTLSKSFVPNATIPAIIIVESPSQLKPAQFQQLTSLTPALAATSGITASTGSVVGPIPSLDGRSVEYIAQIKGKVDVAVAHLTTTVDTHLAGGLKGYVTGPAGLAAAIIGAFKGIDGILVYVALIAVFVILLIVYRSIVLPFLVLMTAMFALSAAGLLVYHAVSAGIFKLNGQSQGILSILAIGAATDYSLLIIARYREGLQHTEFAWDAMREALHRSIEPITASAATVITGVLCLLFSELNSNKGLGPVAALGIAFSYLAAMTFLPAVLVLLGRRAFWPIVPKFIGPAPEVTATSTVSGTGLWQRIPTFISRYPRPIWLICLLVLGGFALVTPQFKASGISQTDAILGTSNAVTGNTVLARHFPAGSGSPAVIIADATKLTQVVAAARQTTNVSSVLAYSRPPLIRQLEPVALVISGRVMVNVTMRVAADSKAGQAVVTNLRKNLADVDSSALVGGPSAILLDTNTAATHDLYTIIPIVLVVILIILMLLLRAVLAPVLLIASVILSFTATIGISALLFNHVFNFAGSDAAIPLFSFIFLVALGVDYNIFLMTRVREEAKKRGTQPGILFGLSVTGSVITSAGVVLAATFAALAVVPVLFLVQIAFIVAFGVLLDTIIVRSLLVPALCYDIGKRIWWPSKLTSK
jgi:RND superfamily putative drug exporter